MKRKLSMLLLVLAMMLSLCACGSKKDARLGRYKGAEINLLGWKPVSEVYPGGDNYLELKSNGKGTLCLDGSRMKLQWQAAEEANELVVTVDNEEMAATLDGTTLTLDFMGFDMTFVRSGR